MLRSNNYIALKGQSNPLLDFTVSGACYAAS